MKPKQRPKRSSWSDLSEFREAVARIRDDLKLPNLSPDLDYLYPYEAIGAVAIGETEPKRKGQINDMSAALKTGLPDRGPNSSFAARAKIQFSEDADGLQKSITLHRQGLEEIGTVDLEELDQDVIWPMTIAQYVIEGMELVGDHVSYEAQLDRQQRLLLPLFGFLAELVLRVAGTGHFVALAGKYPFSSVLWWEKWFHSIEDERASRRRPSGT